MSHEVFSYSISESTFFEIPPPPTKDVHHNSRVCLLPDNMAPARKKNPLITPGGRPEQEWRVRVYRQVTTAEENANGSVTTSWQRLQATSSSGTNSKRVAVRVAPRQGSIVLRRLQIRVRLVMSDDNKDSAAKTPTNTPTPTTPVQMVVTRRRTRVLISSNQSRLRVLLLRFFSERDCLAFCDLLAALNPPPTAAAQQPNSNNSNNPRGNADVLFFVSRLLHDAEFAGFCRRLEASLLATPDGMRALQALAHENDDEEGPQESTTTTSLQQQQQVNKKSLVNG